MNVEIKLPGGDSSLRVSTDEGLSTVQFTVTLESPAEGELRATTFYLERAAARAIGGALIGAAGDVRGRG